MNSRRNVQPPDIPQQMQFDEFRFLKLFKIKFFNHFLQERSGGPNKLKFKHYKKNIGNMTKNIFFF